MPASRAPTARATTQLGTGKLIVRAVPVMVVYVDGKMVAPATPAAISIPSGTHLIRVENVAAKIRVQREVVIMGGKETTLIVDGANKRIEVR